MIDKNNKYTIMQLDVYNKLAENWSESNKNPVVGYFDKHNEWDDYNILFNRLKNENSLIGLDFGCGPGRNIVKYKDRFKRLDGIDISPVNIEKAKIYTKNNKVETSLYISNGIDINLVSSESYDFVMSTIVFQHICVYEIRYSIMKDIYRVLKKGGIFTAQMGFGKLNENLVNYYENFYEATETNGKCDVCVDNPDSLKNDLLNIGYKNFEYVIGPAMPVESQKHSNWIYFSAIK